MAQPAFRVSVPFANYQKGDLIANPGLIAEIMASECRVFGHMTTLEDDHHAVLPHLEDDHPARVEFAKQAAAGAEPDGARPARKRADPPTE